MDIKLGINKYGLFIQYLVKINRKNEQKKVKEKVYNSTQYSISIPIQLINFIDTDVVFMKQHSKNKYSLLLREDGDSKPLKIRTLTSKAKTDPKKYTRYLLTLPKKFFGFLDYEFVDDMVMNIFVYVKDGDVHIDLSL
ncbi:hypothetical protein [Methanosphaera cuniculi]|uniref:hypothetical protein n=1 Tax=Methanosphaera cuniculi TaxID=1077256 RepID=UPI0026E97704|nr:hypothetical protein [Methanosphaera cuniculi]